MTDHLGYPLTDDPPYATTTPITISARARPAPVTMMSFWPQQPKPTPKKVKMEPLVIQPDYRVAAGFFLGISHLYCCGIGNHLLAHTPSL